MNKISRTLLAAALAVVCAEGAFAQAGSAGPAPGTGDSKAIVNQNRETNAEFNRQVGSKDRKANRRKPAVVAATAADLAVGSTVRDQAGTELGKIESIEADGVVIVSAAGKVKVPADSLGKNKTGLLLAISKADFDLAVKNANAAPQG